MKYLLSFFDYTGNWSKPYSEDPEWNVETFDIKNGKDILDFNPVLWMQKVMHSSICLPEVGLLFAIPCTDYALCGSKHFKQKDNDGTTLKSDLLVNKVKSIIDYFESFYCLLFWAVENPKSRIHTRHKWLGKIKYKFNPCDFAGYDPIPDNSRYNKETWLWGNFNNPTKNRIEPFVKEYPGFKKLGGKSERTKELRSITPIGFSYAFYNANNGDL